MNILKWFFNKQKKEKVMLLSEISSQYQGMTGEPLGFTIKSKETGLVMKVIGKTPGGKFIVVKLTGKSPGSESLVEDSTRYELVNDKKMSRKWEIQKELEKLNGEFSEIESKINSLESELEELEEVG